MAVLSIVLPLAIIGLFLASTWYVASWLVSLLSPGWRWPLRIGLAVGLFGSQFGMLAGMDSTSAAVGLVNTLSGYAFAFYLYLLIALLVIHAIKRRWPMTRVLAARSALITAFGLTTIGALLANPVRVAEVEIPLDGLEHEVTVMHISDVHIGHQRGRGFLERLVATTNARQPDMVLINGDLVDAASALEPGVLAPLADFEAPVYFAGGNHDHYVESGRAFGLIEKQGVRVLHNEVVLTDGIALVGLDYMKPDDKTFDMHPSDDQRTIENVMPGLDIPDDRPVVLMHHSPVGADYVAARGVDLMLAGHTHGGQMFPANLLTPFIFPFNAGLYQHGEMAVLVSCGAGTFGPRVRLGTAGEVNLVRLVARP